MRHYLYRIGVLTAFLACLVAPGHAQDTFHVSELSPIDKTYMEQQRQDLNTLSQQSYGQSFTGNKERDLALLQRLLDDGKVRGDQTRELQAMGIIMGDLLSEELNLNWVIYEDKLGRSRALRYRQNEEFLFPVTMIARRREVGNKTPVTEIYQKAKQAIAPSLPALPFQ